ncbi:MAG TPA: XTP/dITP diphosphatase [Candidatus Omnitrophota bacterium]|nr:XTP/dITP diphosphatase [Candidatus Omnitrophota bacterium]HSA31854.1 XTP/dITP diphosphatase [Candidatus Omnitrophota bacterium]
MQTLIIATRNRGKLREIKELLKDLPLKVVSLADYPDMPPIVEDGKTFRANALKKAFTISRKTKMLVLGEDSGLEVEALGWRPGIFSARFSGEQADDEKNNQKLLEELKAVDPKRRRARYRCVAALTDGERFIATVSGSCEGSIAREPRGKNGFGYDPLFLVPEYNKTFGELPPEVKERLSHRGKAMKKVKKFLKRYLGSV